MDLIEYLVMKILDKVCEVQLSTLFVILFYYQAIAIVKDILFNL